MCSVQNFLGFNPFPTANTATTPNGFTSFELPFQIYLLQRGLCFRFSYYGDDVKKWLEDSNLASYSNFVSTQSVS
ncbi:hypothetical protein ISN45_At02g028880 [Arabidopsis thaliana x Arabidopsis arenosa]|uniref:Uncharacterized protein n=2 Tax=Arabidopsis TaxID=3701 RepID=A0A178VWP0_ARATH|nr:hypothetical protein ISN45_At02g028880 [Arabidopsis thaliana x Arabidopsis arenosa]OAP09655.1 hypothetical protein AXX17_AT2G30850 [Arabidopsis thaliana]